MGNANSWFGQKNRLQVEGVEKVFSPEELPELLRVVDFVVLCVPLTKETRKLIGRKELEQLGPNSYLINVSRGEVVDEEALAWVLKKGVIAGAALDVLSSNHPQYSSATEMSQPDRHTSHCGKYLYFQRGNSEAFC